jgi:hypothetical protein
LELGLPVSAVLKERTDVWKKNCAVNSRRGTTWVGVTTVVEQVARQRLGQH